MTAAAPGGKALAGDEVLTALVGLLEAGRPCLVPVQGTSMHPFLKEGDRLHLEPVLPGQLRLGDLIAFRKNGRLVVHRFAGRARRGGASWLRQKGDNLYEHTLVPPEDLVGRVAMVDSAQGSRRMLTGLGRWANGILGCRSWFVCVVRDVLHGTPRP